MNADTIMPKTIQLVNNQLSDSQINSICDWLKTKPKLTQGSLVKKFEEHFADFLGADYAVFVNSGSSAILLGLYSLLEQKKIERGATVGIPAVCWATDLAPVKQLGLKPKLIDINLDDLAAGINSLTLQGVDVLLLVSVLGLVPDMNAIKDYCNETSTILLEDCCESLGSSYNGKKLGTFGDMSFFSTYYGHHLSSIEGGFIVTDNFKTYEVLKMLRAHGWDRDLSNPSKLNLRVSNNISDFDSLYTFYGAGFNFRNTEIGAYIGLEGLKKLDDSIQARRENGNRYRENFKAAKMWAPKKNSYGFESFFAYPVIVPEMQREITVDRLKNKNIECRPLIAGSIENHPLYKNNWGVSDPIKKECPVANLLHVGGFYIPCHEGLGLTEVDYISDIIIDSIVGDI